MLRTHYASELGKIKDGVKKNVKIAGWVHEKRNLGGLLFVVIRDFSGFVQVVCKKGLVSEDIMKKTEQLRKESVVAIEGKVVENKKAPRGIEIVPSKLEIISDVKENLPIDISPGIRTGLDKRLDFRCIDLRTSENLAVFKIQSKLLYEMRSFLNSKGFMQVFTPCLMGIPSESGSEVFSVLYYDKEAFLRQDPQLHRQLAIAGGFEKIYDIGPCWRAEVSHTTRHLCEHRVVAAETSFISDEYDIMKLEEMMVIEALKKLKQDCKKELKLLNVNFEVPKKFPVLEFPAIYDILAKMGLKIKYGESYGTEGEKLLWEYVKKKYDSDFFYVNRFPFAEKPFYVMRYDNEPEFARSTDLLFKGQEMSSGGQREHRYEKIMEQAKQKGMSQKSVKWFADFFKYGVPPHGGFAIGLERLTMALLDLKNIREATAFPRDVDRLVP